MSTTNNTTAVRNAASTRNTPKNAGKGAASAKSIGTRLHVAPKRKTPLSLTESLAGGIQAPEKRWELSGNAVSFTAGTYDKAALIEALTAIEQAECREQAEEYLRAISEDDGRSEAERIAALELMFRSVGDRNKKAYSGHVVGFLKSKAQGAILRMQLTDKHKIQIANALDDVFEGVDIKPYESKNPVSKSSACFLGLCDGLTEAFDGDEQIPVKTRKHISETIRDTSRGVLRVIGERDPAFLLDILANA
ncbi:MAG: hypothetical protein BWY31_01978 [Lentisphaerae bacterium ADurb.Bin242]|nr:MAG: hypothetical protein BWY31_01978 [Lentisphaerae bacterium ADurb.Bin242]